jgi:hypothetical protein
VAAPSFNYYYRVEITLASYDLGGLQSGSSIRREVSYKTVNVVNKQILDGVPSVTYGYYPILQQVGEINLVAGDFLPTLSVSSITLNDSIGSIGPRRKFSDLMQRYTAIGQLVKLYVAEAENFVDAPSSWIQIGEGKVLTWQTACNSEPPTVSFDISPFKLSNRTMNLEIANEVVGMESAPSSALGKHLPIVLSKRETGKTLPSTYPQITPIRITGDGLPSAQYACATHMYRLTKGSLNPDSIIYVRRTWDSVESPWGLVPLGATAPDYRTPNVGTTYALNSFGAVAYKLFPNNALNEERDFIVTGITFACKGNGSALTPTSQCNLTAFILRVDKTNYAVVEEMTRGQAQLANYDASNRLAANFNVKISFDRPVTIPQDDSTDYDFYFGWQATEVGNSELSIRKYSPPSPSSYVYLVQGGGSASNGATAWRPYASTDANQPAYKLETVSGTFTPHVETFTSDGFTYSKISLSQGVPDTGQVAPDLDSLQIVVPMEGLCAYSDGIRISLPHIVLYTLSYEWAGDRWEDRQTIDTTTLAAKYTELFGPNPNSFRARWISGVIDQKITYDNLAREIARATASRIGILYNGKMFLYPWGDTSAAVYDIPPADIAPLSYESRDDSNVINQAVISAEKILTVVENQTEEDGYVITTNYSALAYISIVPMTRQSVSIYGYKNLQDNKFQVFGFHQTTPLVGTPGYLTGESQEIFGLELRSDEYSLDFLGEYYLSRFALSVHYVSFVVPWHRYKNIKMFDIITFSHPAFPSYVGSDPDARIPGVEESGGSVYSASIANDGGELVRAQTYRGIVEGINYVMAMEHAPAIRLTVQVLINQQYDPT